MEVPWQQLSSIAQCAESGAKFTGEIGLGKDLRENLLRLVTDLLQIENPPDHWRVWLFLLRTLLCEDSVKGDDVLVSSLIQKVKNFRPSKSAELKAVNIVRAGLPEVVSKSSTYSATGLPCKLHKLCAYCDLVVSIAEQLNVSWSTAFSAFGKEAGHGHFADCKSPFDGAPMPGRAHRVVNCIRDAPQGPPSYRSKQQVISDENRARLSREQNKLEEVREEITAVIRDNVPEPPMVYRAVSPVYTPPVVEVHAVQEAEAPAASPVTRDRKKFRRSSRDIEHAPTPRQGTPPPTTPSVHVSKRANNGLAKPADARQNSRPQSEGTQVSREPRTFSVRRPNNARDIL